MEVIKRDGKRVAFDAKKIERVINLANKAVDTERRIDDEKVHAIADKVVAKIGNRKEVEVEEIQDLVEQFLLQDKKAYFVGREFSHCREERAKERFKRLDITKRIKEKLDASNVQNQNANVDEHSFGGRKGEAEGELMKQLALDYYINPKFAKNHLNNRIYIHDLDNYVVGMHNCLSEPFDHLLKYGFNTRQTDIRPASSINTAFQLVAVLFQLQSLQQFGGVSATHLDWTMVPYVRKSFWKHYMRQLASYNYYLDKEDAMPVEKTNAANTSIDSKLYKANKKVYDMALEDTVAEAHQAVEGMYHNLNTLQSRSGNQLPFTSINYGTCTLPEGRLVIKALLDCSIDGVGKLHKTPIFPCGIFICKKGINDKGSKNYDLFKLAIKSTSKRLYPNYGNSDWSVNKDGINKDRKVKAEAIASLSDETKAKLKEVFKSKPELAASISLDADLNVLDDIGILEDFSTMGCRTNNAFNINFDKDYFTKILNNIADKGEIPVGTLTSGNQRDGRGNICPATIILPTIAMEAKKKAKDNPEYVVDYFMDILEKAIGDCKDELIERFNWICAQSPSSAKFMYENNTMYGYVSGEGIRSALKHGTLAIGQLGLAEALQILIGCDQTTERGMELAKKIEQLYKDKCAEYKEHYKLNFGVYFTPAENLCFTSFKKFKKKYGDIKNVTYADIEGKEDSDVKDHREFFTNSMHVPVWAKMDPFEKIDIESQLTGYSSAGCITYVELDDRTQNNLKALEQIVEYAMNKDIPYFAINVPADTCTACGFQGNIDNECPVCGAKDEPGIKRIERLRRVTGYLTGSYDTAFNLGKQDEVKHRYKHSESLVDWKSDQ